MIDNTIIIGYLAITFFIGIYKGRGIKNMKDFAIAERSYTTPILVATIFGTIIDSGATIGITEKIITVGIAYMFLFAGEPLVKILVSEFIAPRMQKFTGLISAGDIMGRAYGKPGKVITGFAGLVLAIGYLGAQITAFSAFFHYFTGIPQTTAIIAGATIVVAYSTFGGIRAVTATDVFQFGVIIIAIPLIASVALGKVGGYSQLLTVLPEGKLSFFPSEGSKLEHLFLFLLFCIPFINPMLTQRLLMASDVKQMQRSMRISAALDLPYYILMGTIALSAILLSPEVEARLALPHLIHSYLPVGLKGIAIAGMLSVVMSTSDSCLNSAAISFIHDMVKPLKKHPLSDKQELILTKIATIIIGIFAVTVSLNFESVLDTVITFIGIWGPVVVVPYIATIFDYKATPNSFITATIAATITYICWMLLVPEVDALIPALFANGIAFFIHNKCCRPKSAEL